MFCADVGVTSRFAGITVSDVVAEVVSIDPPEFAGYEHPTGTGADPDALPDGPNKPSDATGGLWLHGDLGPGGRGVARWMFRNPGGAFLFRGRVMGRFPELEDGIDDDCDGQVDNALGAYADGEPCRADEDCVSGVCDAIDPGTGFGTCAITCEEGRWGSPCADCPGGVGVAQCGGNGTCNDGAGGDGVCTCDAGFAPSGTTASDSCTDCVVGYWGASCTACESCNGGSCVDGMSGDGSCVCPEGYHATSRCADSCSDGEQNGDETDVDCGGAVCDACGGGGPTWAQQARITAADSAGADMFGFSVSIDGAYAIVGAQHDDDAGSSSGSAYIFVRSGATWTQQARITAGDAAAGDQFGRSVAISGDYAIVGAQSDDDAGSRSGSAYVFVRSGTTWTQQAKITAADAAADDRFGYSVAISGDTAIIGADLDDDAGTASGSAYVFVRSGAIWTQQAKITAADAATGDSFGSSVAISGESVIVGAAHDDDAGSRSGSVYVFVRSGTAWTQQAKITAADAAAGDDFGFSVAISGESAVVGAYMDDDAGSGSGSAYVFVRSGATWTQQAKITATDIAADDRFGASVAISGESAVVGAFQHNDVGTFSGSAYVFVRSETSWTQQAKITAADDARHGFFGISVAISGSYAVVGAFGDTGSRGAAYIFH